MAAYLIVNTCFMLIVMLIGRIFARRFSKPILLTLLALLLLTAMFDSMIVGFGIVAYDPALISGIYIGKAPIEDFFYAVFAVMLVPTVWNRLGDKDVRNN